jgi:hypothetical protein
MDATGDRQPVGQGEGKVSRPVSVSNDWHGGRLPIRTAIRNDLMDLKLTGNKAPFYPKKVAVRVRILSLPLRSSSRFPQLGGRPIGRTPDSGSGYPGSSPGLPAKFSP